jgi:hypothetical protein
MVNWAEQCLHFFDENGAPKRPIDPQTDKAVKDARDARENADAMPWDDVRCIYRGQSMVDFDKKYYQQLRDKLTVDIEETENALQTDENEYHDLIRGHQEYLAFIEMEKSWYSKPLVRTPYDLLVMGLVMLMGALGGIVRILRDFLDPARSNPAAKHYFFIPAIGMVVAIGGFVLAKTGLLLLSSAKDETSLSPFMIGLVGMVSGLLAKEVIDRIIAVGRPMLRSGKSGAGTARGKSGGESDAGRGPESGEHKQGNRKVAEHKQQR